MPSFIHFGFLFAGLAVGVPILIHLMFRQRARTMPIGSLRFLQQVIRQHQRRRRLRQFLLLLLRCLAVLLLALLFARPYWDSRFRDALQREVVVLVDRSASMATADARGLTAMEQAWRAAAKAVSDLDENVIVHLALCDAAGVTELPATQLNQPVPAASEAATDYGLALSWARDLLATSARTDQRIVLITDLQRSGIGRTPLTRTGEALQVDLIDVGHAISEDLAVTSVEVVRAELRPGVPILVSALVRNHSPTAVRDVPVWLRLTGPGGKLERQRRQTLPAAGVIRVEWQLEPSEEGVYQGEVAIEMPDAAEWNNRRYLAFDARPPDRVLLVDGDEGTAVYGNETYYLEKALRLPPPPGVATARSFEVERLVWESGAGFPRLNGFRAIILCNVRRLRQLDIERLAAFTSAGGNVWWLAGDKLEPESMDALYQAGLLPGRLTRRAITSAGRVTSWDKEHVALEPFADPQRGDLRRIEFTKLWPLDELAPEARMLLQAGPIVLAAERRLGQGGSLYLGLTADRAWTEWPQSRMYVPLVRQLTGYLTGQLAERPKVQTAVVERPEQRAGLTQQAEVLLVTNTDPSELVPDRMTADQFRAALGLADLELTEEELAARAELALPANMSRPDEIWTLVLWILLAILAMETLLASRVHA